MPMIAHLRTGATEACARKEITSVADHILRLALHSEKSVRHLHSQCISYLAGHGASHRLHDCEQLEGAVVANFRQGRKAKV